MENAIDVWALANMAANALTQLTWSKSANFLQEHDMENSREDKNPAVTSGTQETDKETAVFLKRIWMRHASDSAHFVRVHQQLFLFCCWNQWNVARLRSLSAWMIVIHLFLLFRVGGRGGGSGCGFFQLAGRPEMRAPLPYVTNSILPRPHSFIYCRLCLEMDCLATLPHFPSAEQLADSESMSSAAVSLLFWPREEKRKTTEWTAQRCQTVLAAKILRPFL